MPQYTHAELRRRNQTIRKRNYRTIHDYAAALVQLVHHYDSDGRPIGFDYGYIRDRVLVKFPVEIGRAHV